MQLSIWLNNEAAAYEQTSEPEATRTTKVRCTADSIRYLFQCDQPQTLLSGSSQKTLALNVINARCCADMLNI